MLDPMCGSGTALVAAELSGRRWIGIDIAAEAIELAKVRLDQPAKTVSRLLEVGKEAYLNHDEKTTHILEGLKALIVQRNNGIDGFLKTHYFETPVAIRVQKDNESLEEARKQLLKASKTKGCILKILVKTSSYESSSMFDLQNIDDNLLVIDSHEIVIDQWLIEKQNRLDRKKVSAGIF